MTDEAENFLLDDAPPLESVRMPGPGMIRRQGKARMVAMLKREHLREIMPLPPEPGVHYHLISNGKADFWTWIPCMLDWYGTAEELYISTWTLNRTAVVELGELLDAGRIRQASFLTGLYFKRRETSVYAALLECLHARGMRYVCFENHAKVTLIASGARRLVVAGSANLTANPRLEQYVLVDDPDVYAFHRAWMEDMLK